MVIINTSTIWIFCNFCMHNADQRFVRNETNWTVYECSECRRENRVAVKKRVPKSNQLVRRKIYNG